MVETHDILILDNLIFPHFLCETHVLHLAPLQVIVGT